MRGARVVVVIGALGVAGFVPAAAAGAVHAVACGAVIVEDATLGDDLDCTGLGGLTIGADGVTLDLGGHTITNGGISVGTPDAASDDVEVRHGTLVGAGVAVMGSRTVVDGLSIHEAPVAVAVGAVASDRVDDTLVARTEIVGAGRGRTLGALVVAPSAGRFTLAGSTIRGSGAAINAEGGAGSTVTGNRFLGNEVVFGGQEPGEGYTFFANEIDGGSITLSESDRNRFAGNEMTGVTLDCSISSGTVLTANLLRDGEVRLGSLCGPTTVRRNVFEGGTVALRVDLVGGSTIEENVFRDQGAAGILGDARDTFGTATVVNGFGGPLTIRRNVFARIGRDPGGLVDSGGDMVDDGIHLRNAAAEDHVILSGNFAFLNADAGIDVDGVEVSDEGGNRAGLNGGAVQCVGLACSP